jgi:hypothetical protein
LGAWPDPAALGDALFTALAARYGACHPDGSALHEFPQSGATYLFDLASAVGVAPGLLRSLIYADDAADPSQIEIGVLRGATLHEEHFDNRSAGR